MDSNPTDNAPGLDTFDVLEHAVARGDLAARWYLRARARGETFTEAHARAVAALVDVEPRALTHFARPGAEPSAPWAKGLLRWAK